MQLTLKCIVKNSRFLSSASQVTRNFVYLIISINFNIVEKPTDQYWWYVFWQDTIMGSQVKCDIFFVNKPTIQPAAWKKKSQ